jgi:hypothetical protein
VGKSKTAAGTGRIIPLNPRAVTALTHGRGPFPGAEAEHYVFPHEKYGLAGNDRKQCAYEIIPTEPMHCWKVAWESARKAAKVSCRFHDLRHTFISRLAESQASDSTVMALAGHVSRAMMERYSHIRMEAKRRAVGNLSGTDFEPGVAQNWAQFFVSEKSDEANSLKRSGEPGRTRTSNPLIKRPFWPLSSKVNRFIRNERIPLNLLEFCSSVGILLVPSGSVKIVPESPQKSPQ